MTFKNYFAKEIVQLPGGLFTVRKRNIFFVYRYFYFSEGRFCRSLKTVLDNNAGYLSPDEVKERYDRAMRERFPPKPRVNVVGYL